MTVNITGVTPGSNIDSLFKTVGFVVVQWGHCERSLELLVNTLFLQYGGDKLPRRRRIPKQLSDKISFVKECILQIPSLALFRIELEALVIGFEEIMKKRHDLVHGALTDYPSVDGVFTFIRLKTHPDAHEINYFQYDINDFPPLEASLLRLGADAPKVAKRVFDARPKPL